MLGGAAASSFTDDIVKWQKTLQNIESVLVAWWEVQEKWMKLDDVCCLNNIMLLLTEWEDSAGISYLLPIPY